LEVKRDHFQREGLTIMGIYIIIAILGALWLVFTA
jgi:hypothetical protein